MKICCWCHVARPLSDFPIHRNRRDGRGTACKDCHREYMREYVRNHRDRDQHAATQRAYRARNPGRAKAHSAVRRALRSGELIKPANCERCDGPAEEAHHHDYAKPLDVVWLCTICHGAEHRAVAA